MTAPRLPNGQLTFLFSEIEEELRSLPSVTGTFLDRTAIGVLERFTERLRTLRAAPAGRPLRWEIYPAEPVLTEVASLGTGRRFRAEIDGVWEIEPLGPHNTGSLRHRHFALAGLASARVRFVNQDSAEVAMWRMEIGNPGAPGCFFHTQVRGQDPSLPFPSDIPVPRLPGHAMMLPSTIEYVVGELFQERWAQEASVDTSPMRQWRRIQQGRLIAQFDWARAVVLDSTGSPWARLKRALPPSNLFDG